MLLFFFGFFVVFFLDMIDFLIDVGIDLRLSCINFLLGVFLLFEEFFLLSLGFFCG